MKTKNRTFAIEGYSDDYFGVSGDPQLNDDCYADAGYVELSTGDVFEVDYSDAVWTVEHVINRGLVKTTHTPNEGGDSDNYSDRMEVSGPVEWVDLWKSWPPSIEDKARKGQELVDGLDPDGEDMAAIYDLLVARKRERLKRRPMSTRRD